MIKIICGTFGKYENGRVVVKDSKSDPFTLAPEKEARLVAAKMAVYVTAAPVDESEKNEAEPAAGDMPEYNETMNANELRKIGKAKGLTFKVGMTKAEMVAELDKLNGDVDESEEIDEYTEDDEEAPTFDPVEAVVE